MWFFALVIVLLIGAVAVVASGRWGSMAEVYDDRPDALVPARRALTADDIEASRFAVGVRGYRMDEVDTLLERLAREVAERDRRIADLERAVSPIVSGPEGAGFTARAEYAEEAYAEDEVVSYAEAEERYDGEDAPAAEAAYGQNGAVPDGSAAVPDANGAVPDGKGAVPDSDEVGETARHP
jgi:DivIVA domain-containing protein